jgi:hypothetical protein
MNETLGYSASALFAKVYGWLETNMVSCDWTREAAQRSEECQLATDVCQTADNWMQVRSSTQDLYYYYYH